MGPRDHGLLIKLVDYDGTGHALEYYGGGATTIIPACD